jgi:hypothetical protein
MPTPKEWHENLERLQQITGTKPKIVEERPEEAIDADAIDEALSALLEVRRASVGLAKEMLEKIYNSPTEGHLDIATGYIIGAALAVLVGKNAEPDK